MKKMIGLIAVMFFLIGTSAAQVPYFQHYSLLKKNEPIQVNTIRQDKTGFIWFGTNKGLFKFDGITLKRFAKSDGLSNDNVTAIAQDSTERIWIGHKNGTISILTQDSIESFSPREGTPTKEISDILFDHNGILWISTLNDGLYYFKNNRLFRLDEDEGMPDLFIYHLALDSHGNVLAGTDAGMAIISIAAGKPTIDVVDYTRGLPDNIVKKIVIDHGKILMATEDKGIVIYDPETKKVNSLITDPWQYGAITDFILDNDQIWISSKQAGIIVLDKDGKRQPRLYNSKSGADFASVNTLANDTEGNIWIGSKTGVERARGNQFEFIEKFNPTLDDNIVAVAMAQNGDIFFANKEGLYKRHIDESGAAYVTKMLANTSYEKYTVISLYTDPDGYLWAGLYGEGLLRIDPRSGKIRWFNKELRNGNILSITGNGKYLWAATLGGATRITLEKDNLSFKNFSTSDGLSTDYIYQIFVDHAKHVWFATDGKGVDMLDENGFHHFGVGDNSAVVYGLAEDGNHTLWANVQNEGLYRLIKNKFEPFTSTPLRNSNVNALTTDVHGNLVIMHDDGIDLYNAGKNSITYIGNNVGMKNRTANLNAVTTGYDGEILIGTDNGVIRYNAIREETKHRPIPAIESIRLPDKNMTPVNGLNFRYNQNYLTINYRCFWYEDPDNVSYEYILENYDLRWIVSSDRAVVYSNLPPGEYTFKVRASDDGKFADAPVASFSFTIAAPFWQTWWFYFVVILSAVGIVYLYIRQRERNLMRDKEILEAKVHERTLEIQKNNEEIQAQNEEIQSQAEEILGINENLEELVKQRTQELERKNKALEEYAFINAHELRAPLASILGLIDLISKTELNDECKTIVNHMEGSAERLDAIVRSITKAIERGEEPTFRKD